MALTVLHPEAGGDLRISSLAVGLVERWAGKAERVRLDCMLSPPCACPQAGPVVLGCRVRRVTGCPQLGACGGLLPAERCMPMSAWL